MNDDEGAIVLDLYRHRVGHCSGRMRRLNGIECWHGLSAGANEQPQKPAMQKVSANTASEEEIDAALRSAGVSNSGRWADEVVEYRPYPADDPNLSKLRENLAKYNPGQDTTDKIVSVLTP